MKHAKKSFHRQIASPEDIQELARAFQESRVLLSAFELDIFSALDRKSRTAGQVAGRLNVNTPAVERLLNALCALGLVAKKKGRFSNADVAARFLVKGEKGYMAGLMHASGLWKSWSTLTEAVQKGEKIIKKPIKDRSPEWFEAFIAAMHQRAVKTAPAVVSRLDLRHVSRVLDIGGGSGGYAMGFVRAGKGIAATVFDLPNVIPLTRRYIEAAGLSDRVDTAQGDYYVDELGEGYDLVFMSAIIHINSAGQNRTLIRKAVRALNPGGQVVVQDFIMNEDRTGPLFAALFALNMLVGTEQGDTYTESEIKGWMKQAGLKNIQRLETGGPASLMVGRRTVSGSPVAVNRKGGNHDRN